MFKSIKAPSSIPPQTETRLAQLTAQLTCLPTTTERPWADYTQLAQSVGLTPEKDGLTDPQQRQEAEVELNALVAQLYGYNKTTYADMMTQQFIRGNAAEEHRDLMQKIQTQLP